MADPSSTQLSISPLPVQATAITSSYVLVRPTSNSSKMSATDYSTSITDTAAAVQHGAPLSSIPSQSHFPTEPALTDNTPEKVNPASGVPCSYWWLAHPPYDSKAHIMGDWLCCTLSQWCSTAPDDQGQQSTGMASIVAVPLLVAIPTSVGCALGGVAQWRLARRATAHLCSPFNRPLLAATTAATCAPVAAVAAMLTWMGLYYCGALGVVLATPVARPDPSTSRLRYWAHSWLASAGLRAWPLPIRPDPVAHDSVAASVPAWVDSPPPSSLTARDLLDWKRWMCEEWKYTADDVRVRTRVNQTTMAAIWLPHPVATFGLSALAFRCRHAAVVGASSFGLRRVAAGGSRWWKLLGGGAALLYGPVTGVAAWYSGAAVNRLIWPVCRRCNDQLVQQLDPVHSAFRRVYFASDY